jgi:hypothetical protein
MVKVALYVCCPGAGTPLLTTVPVTEIVTLCGAAVAGRALVVIGNGACVVPGVTSI